MSKEKFVVWSNLDLDLDDWRADLEDEYPGLNDDELIEKMNEINDSYIDDERANLDIVTGTEIIAIADYIAYVYTYKKAIRTMNRDTMALAKDLKQNWLFHCDAARVPEYVSQEEMNKILDVQSSWGRKVFNKSYKPVM